MFSSSYKVRQETGIRFKQAESVGGIFAWTTDYLRSERPIPLDRETQEAC